MNAATRAVIERLVEALEQYAPRDRAVTQDLIAGARKLLEDDSPKTQAPCPHVEEPRGCYRVRCQLGRKCVDPKTGFSLTPQPPNGRPMLTPEQREIAIKKLCELCGSAGDVEWIAEFAGQQIDGVLLLPAYKAIQYAKEQPK